MSGASAAAKATTETAQAAVRAERKGWIDDLQEEAITFLKGDNNAPWAILAETVIGCVPILGQIVDARDIIKGLIEVSGAPASPLAWFNLITALIGLIPGGGDAAKRSLRAVKSGAANIDDLLDMIRRLYKGDPEKLLKDVLDLGPLKKKLDDILSNPNLLSRVTPEVRKSIDEIRSGLAKQFDAFKKEIDDWLAKGRKTSADTGPAAKTAPGTPPAKPDTNAKAGSQGKGQHANDASPNTPTHATQKTARFKQLSQKVAGVMGEHMADFHCQDIKGWGSPKAAHDKSQYNPAKLNDEGRLVNLWPPIPRGRGIDAVWKSNGPKPYAVIEAKASYDPTKGIAALLGEAGDKNEKGGASTSPSGRRTGRSGSKGSGSSSNSDGRQTNGNVTQMSHGWIQHRMQKAIGASSPDWPTLRDRRERVYTRHVLFFSIPQAVAHAEALIMLTAGQKVEDAFHAAHEVTREWGDDAIEKVVDKRAGHTGAARDKRKR